jgi:4-hydroxybenzoate polyprenyltransferase
MKEILKLIRIQNLIIVAATQYLMRFAIIRPILKVSDFSLQFSEFDFFILVFSTLCLTAAGYVINDYFDTKTDAYNKPEKVVVGRSVSRRSAMALHFVLNVLGILGGFYASFVIGHLKFGFIFILITGILWYYSTTYKRQFLIGNILVALLTAMVPLMVILFELPLLINAYAEILIANNANLNHVLYWVLAFSFFAFITTLIREIIKDMEDFEGDNAYGRNTLPIVLGINYTKVIILFLISSTLAAFTLIYLKFLQGSAITLWYLLLVLVCPFLYLIYRIVKAKSKNDYRFASNLMKIIMLGGILYSLVAAYIFLYLF